MEPKKERYWTKKHYAKTNFEVIRTIASIVQMVGTLLILAKLFGLI